MLDYTKELRELIETQNAEDIKAKLLNGLKYLDKQHEKTKQVWENLREKIKSEGDIPTIHEYIRRYNNAEDERKNQNKILQFLYIILDLKI